MNRTMLTVTRALAAVVALVAGYVSYIHIVDVALAVGERAEVALALPITVDALMVMCTLALLHDRSNRWAQAGFLFGVAVSVTCNVASAEPTWPARGVAAIPAVVLLLAVEVLVRSGRQSGHQPARVATQRRTEPAAAPTNNGHGHGRTGGRKRRGDAAAAVRTAMAAHPDVSMAELARLAGVSRSTVRRQRLNGAEVAAQATNATNDK